VASRAFTDCAGLIHWTSRGFFRRRRQRRRNPDSVAQEVNRSGQMIAVLGLKAGTVSVIRRVSTAASSRTSPAVHQADRRWYGKTAKSGAAVCGSRRGLRQWPRVRLTRCRAAPDAHHAGSGRGINAGSTNCFSISRVPGSLVPITSRRVRRRRVVVCVLGGAWGGAMSTLRQAPS
jgi:hypothetical protein